MNGKQLKNSILQWAIQGKLVPPACRQAGKTLMTNPQPRIASQKCWFTYVIECEDGTFYKGFTDDLVRRYKQHCDGVGAEYTKVHSPKQLYYWEMHYTQEEAIAREKYLKSGVGREWFQREVVDKPENWAPATVLLERIRAEKASLSGRQARLIKKDKNPARPAGGETIIYRGLPDGQAGDDNSHYEKLPDGSVRCIDDEIPFEIPSSWAWVRLGTLFSHCSGKALNGSDKGGNPFQYITTSNLYWNRFELDNLRTMNFRDSELEKCTATKGDLLVCEGGDIGRAAIWNFDYDIKIQNHIHKLRAYYPLCTKFFYYVFFLYKHIGLIGGKGIGIQGLSSGALHQIILPVAPLNEQFRIVQGIDDIIPILDKYTESQQSLDDLNAEIYDLLKKSILQEAIQGRLVEQNETDEPASELLKRIQQEKQKLLSAGKLKAKDIVNSVIFKGDDNKYYEKCGSTITCIDGEIPFEIPSNWQWVRIKSIFHTTSGGTPIKGHPEYYINGTIPWVKSGELKTKYLYDSEDKITQEALEHSSAKYFPINTVAVAMYGATIGKTSIFKSELTTNQAICGIFPILYVIPEYLYYFIQYKTTDYLSIAFGSGQPNISQDKIKNTLFPLPPLAEQQRIIAKIEQALASIMSR